VTRIFIAETFAVGDAVVLPAPALRHVQALRLARGDAIVLFNGSDGADWPGELVEIGRSRAVVRVGRPVAVERELACAVTLAIGMPANDRMDALVEKAGELGAAAIQPVTMARSVARLDAERALKRRAHWQQIAIAACEQCGRNRLPAVGSLLDFTAWIRNTARAPTAWLFDPDDGSPLGTLLRPASPIECLVGPEGGLDEHETAMARAAGFVGVRAGPRVMRTETAGAAVLAAVNALWGDWR
jgi:16S rRNA (uracil1498-N3)-methyltransferase